MTTTDMHLFGPDGVIKKYDTPEQILQEFFHLRLEFYAKRKEVLLADRQQELSKLENKVNFILAVRNVEISVCSSSRAIPLYLELEQKGFSPFPKKTKALEPDDTEETEDISESASASKARAYEYLTSMSFWTLTMETVQALRAEIDKVKEEVHELKMSTPQTLWLKDLDSLEVQLNELEEVKSAHAAQASKEAPKAPRKITKAAAETEEATSCCVIEMEKAPVLGKRGGGAAPKAASAAKKVCTAKEEDAIEILTREISSSLG